MTTPCSVHLIGWATYILSSSWQSSIVAEAGAENESRHRANSGARRHLREALGRDDRGDRDHGIVAEVKEKTRENRSGPGPCKREDNADESQEAHKAPGPSELCAVHEAKQGSSDKIGRASCRERVY